MLLGARAAIHIVLASQMLNLNLEGIHGLDSFGLWLQPMYTVTIRTALAWSAPAALR
ncbi:MAG TPA: hypothetical protein VGG73_17240 [Vicinamibacterales bacterium]